jgi:hypothetical protein
MPNELNSDFLREEYFYLQKAVESSDERALLVKGRSVTASLAAIGAALKEGLLDLLLLA